MTVETLSRHRSFDGEQSFHRHDAASTGGSMRFGIYRPDAASGAALIYLAGLTCNEETFAIKAGAQQHAARHGLTLILADTSPRDTGLPGAKDDWDFGEGAGFYLDASEAPWSSRFRMESYLVDELLPLVVDLFSLDAGRVGIFGHSMGGHGALTLALRHPEQFRSVSAFAPIASPTLCPWGDKAFTRYLGTDRATWAAHDASLLMTSAHRPFADGILIDQGLADPFLAEQLHPEAFEAACRAADQPLVSRRQRGYDHGYWFVSTFVGDHIAHHARALGR